MGHWASKRLEDHELRKYQAIANADSLDGLAGLRVAMRDRGENLWIIGLRTWLTRIALQWEALAIGILLGAVMVLLLLVQDAFPVRRKGMIL